MAPRKTATKEKPIMDEIPELKEKTRKPRAETASDVKASVAVAAIVGEKSIAELARDFGVEQASVNLWKTQALQAIVDRFENPPRKGRTKAPAKEGSRTASVLATLKSLQGKKQQLGNGALGSHAEFEEEDEA